MKIIKSDEVTVRAELYGNDGQGYINELIINKNIKLWDIESKGNVITFNIHVSDYRTAAETARDLGGKIKAIKKRGAYFALRNYRNRYGILFGALAFAFIIITLSNYILDIRVSGNQEVSDNQIVEHLNTIGISTWIHTGDINKTLAEASLLRAFDRLAWTSVELQGSRLYIKISEKEATNASNFSTEIPCNIVANRTGRIVETEVYRGKLTRPLGSGVAKGEMIVSGTIDDGAGNILFQHADAKIIAECEEFVTFFVPYFSIEKKKTGRVTQKDYIEFLGGSFPLFLNGKVPENSTYHEQMRHPSFLGLKLPLRIKSAVYTEYEEIEVIRLTEDVLSELTKQIDNYEKNFYGDTEIVKWYTEYLPDEDGVHAEVSIVYRTNIAEKSEIYAR
ncbi:MAG: sporulation protein YqfD [Eubacterium sp.]|jgi:similar to stage IV sporulation protein|nr:sporulation protein YqfD [Eubacterium sp.]